MDERKFDNDSLDAMFYTCTTFFAHRWQLSILIYLFSGPKHFGEILKYHEGLSKKVLSSILQKLESKEVIQRRVYTEDSVTRVEYSLTEKGLALQPILNDIAEWGEKYSPYGKNASNSDKTDIEPDDEKTDPALASNDV